MILGAHLSIAGGLHKALEKAASLGFQTCGMFVRNQVQWRAPVLSEEAVDTFRRTRQRVGLGPIVAHGSYLVNLAGDATVRPKSIAAMVEDLDRCGRLGIEYLVFHPGSHVEEDVGLRRVAEALDEIVDRCPQSEPTILLETTAGQGSSLGCSFEQLARILDGARRSDRLGVCLDTCHVFAAGWDIRSPGRYEEMLASLEACVGLGRLGALHLNDSKKPLASRVDRHEHIGQGQIGKAAFGRIVRDDRLAGLAMILETPKGQDARGRDWDAVNAATLRRLARRR